MCRRLFSIGVWTEVSGIDGTEIGNDYPVKLHLPPHHYRKFLLGQARGLPLQFLLQDFLTKMRAAGVRLDLDG